jgi:hypothetical protein
MPTDIIARLATSLRSTRRGAQSRSLASAIVKANDDKGGRELVENLENKIGLFVPTALKCYTKSGTARPKLIAGYTNAF